MQSGAEFGGPASGALAYARLVLIDFGPAGPDPISQSGDRGAVNGSRARIPRKGGATAALPRDAQCRRWREDASALQCGNRGWRVSESGPLPDAFRSSSLIGLDRGPCFDSWPFAAPGSSWPEQAGGTL